MEHPSRTIGYAVGTAVLLLVLLLVAAITTGILPLRESYAENPWPPSDTDVVQPVPSDEPQGDGDATPAPTATPSPTPSPTPTPIPTMPPTTPEITLDEELPTYTITVTYGRGGTTIPYGTSTVVQNGSMTVIAVPDEGYAVGEILIDGVSHGPLDSYEFEQVTQNHTVYVSFDRRVFAPTPVPTPTPTPVPEVSDQQSFEE